MKYLLLLFTFSAFGVVPMIEENITTQKFKYTRWKITEGDSISSGGTPISSTDFETKFSHGISFQANVDCPSGLCDTEIKVFSSVNCVDYVEIDDITESQTGSCNIVVNIAGAYFKCFRLQLENSNASPASIDAWVSIKEAL